jgi:lipoprotein NlpI
MSLVRCVTTAWLLLTLAEAGAAQSPQQIDWCAGKNSPTPDLRISSCTELIQNGKYAGRDRAQVLNFRATAYIDSGQHDRAIADYDEAMRFAPNDATLFFNRGVAYYQKGQPDRAIADYDQAIKLDPNYTDPLGNRGALYNDKGQHDLAIADFDRVLRLDRNNVQALNNRGIAYGDKGQHVRAIADYDQAIRLNPNHAEAFNNRCLARTHTGEPQLAVSDCSQTLRFLPNATGTLQLRGINLLKLGRAATAFGERLRHFNAAIADFDAALKINSRLAIALYGRGIAKQEIGRRASGEIDRALAVSINKNVVEELTRFGVKTSP